jgi:hypothetical protein
MTVHTLANRKGRCPYTNWIADHHPTTEGVVHTEFPIVGAWLRQYCDAVPLGVKEFRKPRGKAKLPTYHAYRVPNVAEAYELMREGIAIMESGGWTA